MARKLPAPPDQSAQPGFRLNLLLMNLLIQDLGIVEVELFGNETIRRRFEEGASDNSHSQVNSRTHGQDYDQYDVFPHFLFPVLIHKLLSAGNASASHR